MKKLIAIALVLMLCLAIMPMAFADDSRRVRLPRGEREESD